MTIIQLFALHITTTKKTLHIDQTQNSKGKMHRNDTIFFQNDKKMHFLKLNSPISFIKFMDFYGFTIKPKKNTITNKNIKNNIKIILQ